MPDLDTPEELLQQEQTIHKVILDRLARGSGIQEDQQQSLAWRLAQIFVASRVLYTRMMPEFMEGDADEEETLELLGEVRMNLLNIKDLVEEFEDAFLESLQTRQDEADSQPDLEDEMDG